MLLNPMPGMSVRYTGGNLLKRYADEIKGKVGEILSSVEGSKAVVVEFGNAAFIVDPANLEKYSFKEKNEGPEVLSKVLRKWHVEEVEPK